MADTGVEPVGSSESPPAHGGHGIKATLKRIKPGEWVLIALGVASLVVFYIWYQNNQGSAAGVTGSATGTNPNWGNAQTGDSGTFAGEIADLLSQIASGGFTVPPTAVTPVASSAGGGGNSPVASGIAGGAQGSGSQSTSPSGLVGTISGLASSGSGLNQNNNNQAPGGNLASFINGSVNGTSGYTGNVGVQVPVYDANGTQIGATTVPPNVTPGPIAANSAAQTVGSVQTPTAAPVGVVTSQGTKPAAKPQPTQPEKGPVFTEPTTPKPVTQPKPQPVKTPTKAPPNVRPRA